MKTRLLIIIGIIMMTTIPFVTFAALDRYENYLEQLEYERQAIENEPKPGERSYIEPELKAKLEGIELDLREKVRQLHEDLPASSYAVNLNHQTKEIEAVIENKELIPIIKEFTKKYPDDVTIVVEYGKISFDGFTFRPNDDISTWISLPITSCGYPWHESNYEKTKQYSVEYRNIFGNYDSSDPIESAEAMHYVITRYYEDIGKDILDVKTTVDHSIPRTGEGCHTTVGGTWHLQIQNSDLEYFMDNGYDVFTEPMKNAIFYEGDGHYDYLPINHNPNMMAMEKIELQDDNSIDVEFGQNNYEWSTGYKPIPEFEYTANFKVNDTFVVLCTNIGKDGYAESHPDLSEPYLPGLGIVKYLGPITIENEPLLLFWHESVTIPVDMPCSYPEIIHHSINLWQLEEHGLPTDNLVNALGSNYKN